MPRCGAPRNFARKSGDAMTVLELNHVAIHITDVARSAEFYQRVLRLEPLPRPAFNFPGAWFRLGANQELHLIANHGAVVFHVSVIVKGAQADFSALN